MQSSSRRILFFKPFLSHLFLIWRAIPVTISKLSRNHNHFIWYLSAIILGLISGSYSATEVQQLGIFIAEVFIRIFHCLSAPIIALSLIMTLSTCVGKAMSKMWQKTLIYTLTTTMIATLVAMGLYLILQPAQLALNIENNVTHGLALPGGVNQQAGYIQHLAKIIPNSFISPFIDNQVLGILLLASVIGFAIPCIPEQASRDIVLQFFRGLHSILFVITRWVIAILPIGIFGFIMVAVQQYHNNPVQFSGLGKYFTVILLANLLQGLCVLPLWLKWQGLKPYQTMKKMMPALSVAFFSKSSAGTLPLTMTTAEQSLGLKNSVTRFVLPLCTTVNMNGCAAFIFTTVIFIMQQQGIDISLSTMLLWVVIATIAAIGNAGVPMGCYFLSASLLASMNVPIILLGIILPIYGLIDMVETALNVWSDCCVATVIDKKGFVE